MKIGIFTIFDAYNYGSFLQAFSLQTFLEERGHTVYMIDVRESIKSIISQKYLSKSLSRSILKLKRFFNYKKDWKYLNIVSKKRYPKLDLAIIGSDEVWNIENPSFDHSLLFYGTELNASKIIAYAPSLGYSTLDSYKKHSNLCKSIKESIIWFGVRDDFTLDFLKQLGIGKINKVCDPTILLYDKWRKYERPINLPEQPYLIYYSYSEDTPFKEYILRFASERGLKVISIGFNHKWCHNRIIASPFEFLSFMRNASYIITSTFHGTLFSTIYEKKFIEVTPARKVVDFLNQIDLMRVADINDDYESFKQILNNDIDYGSIKNIFDNMRLKSVELLERDNFL